MLDIGSQISIRNILTKLVGKIQTRLAEHVGITAFWGTMEAQQGLHRPLDPKAAKIRALSYSDRYLEDLKQGGTTINGEFIPWFQKYGAKENADTLVRIIEDGISRGKPLGRWESREPGVTGYDSGTVADDIMKHMGQQYKSGASTIARTETMRYLSESALDRYEDALIEKVVVRDGCGCWECAAINGQVWTIEEARMRVLQHPNCRRSFTPIVPGYPIPKEKAASPMPEDDPGSSSYIGSGD